MPDLKGRGGAPRDFLAHPRAWLWVALALAALLAGAGLAPRVGAERQQHTVGLVMEYRDLVSLARESGVSPQRLWARLHSLGMRGLTVSEGTGKDLLNGGFPLRWTPAKDLPSSVPIPPGLPGDRGVLWGRADEAAWQVFLPYLSTKMPGLVRESGGGWLAAVFPASFPELLDSGLLPDLAGLDFARRNGIPVVFRPSPCLGVEGGRVAASLGLLMDQYPEIRSILPSGLVVPGYPDLDPLAALLEERRVPVAQAEFVKQIGVSELVERVFPLVLPLHSLVKDEIFSRRMSREQVVERMVRAAHERSVRLLLFRPYDLYNGHRLPFFLEDLESLSDSLKARGYELGWPSTLPLWGRSPLAVLGASLALAAFALALGRRFGLRGLASAGSGRWGVFLGGGTVLVALGVWALPPAGRYLGGFLGALAATEATLAALDREDHPFRGAFEGLFLVLAAGACLASFYGTPEFMLRLRGFSGVKLTLLLPPLLVLLHDLRNRIHPEGLGEILARPPLWGELLAAGLVLGAVLFMAVRSDNTALVPQWELHAREMLERLLRVRPRTKEFLVGYPCLLLAILASRRNLWPRYREILRVGASLAFASAVNSFCHLHSPFALTLLRVFNGWWAGLLLGGGLFLAWEMRFSRRKGAEAP